MNSTLLIKNITHLIIGLVISTWLFVTIVENESSNSSWMYIIGTFPGILIYTILNAMILYLLPKALKKENGAIIALFATPIISLILVFTNLLVPLKLYLFFTITLTIVNFISFTLLKYKTQD